MRRFAPLLVLVTLLLLLLPAAAGAAPINASCNGGGCGGGWYKTNVTVAFSYDTAGVASVTGCGSASVSSDTPGVSFGCTVRYTNGSTASLGVAIRRDATPPNVTGATADRPPDSSGWYNHPVKFTFQGNDVTSGIGSCSSTTYSGPDGATASFGGSCTDGAGNEKSASWSTKYDATPPTLTDMSAKSVEPTAVLKWKASPDTASVEVTRSPGADGAPSSTVYKGSADTFTDPNVSSGVKYVYSFVAVDEAGNRGSQTISVVPVALLYSPARGAAVKAPPQLAWRKVAGARYYNVQLFFEGPVKALRVLSGQAAARKVLSVWPKQPRFRLTRKWVYKNKKYKLAPGHYFWFVWPGFGDRSKNKYGPLLGKSDFTVR